MDLIEQHEFKGWLERVVKGSGSKIEASSVFLSIFPQSYIENPQCALELGIAIMLDKPIYLLAPIGTKIPDNLRRLARGAEFFNPDMPGDLGEKAKRLLPPSGPSAEPPVSEDGAPPSAHQAAQRVESLERELEKIRARLETKILIQMDAWSAVYDEAAERLRALLKKGGSLD